MLPVTASTVRLFLHVLGATVWVGGQLTLAVLVPVVRGGGADLTRRVARRFQMVAWPAFALLLVTGVWNLADARLGDRSSEYISTLSLKLVLVVVSGAAAAAHAFLTGPRVADTEDDATARRRRALSGATASLGLLAALGATFLGVLL